MIDLFDVSFDGKVVTRIKTGNKLKQTLMRNGYMKVHTMIDKKMVNVLVHRLVATKYIPRPKGKNFVNHKDGDKTNNHAENLEWVTELENMYHAKMQGLLNPVMNEAHPAHKLTDIQVSEIRLAYVPRCRFNGTRALARKYGVNQSVISEIVNNKARKERTDGIQIKPRIQRLHD